MSNKNPQKTADLDTYSVYELAKELSFTHPKKAIPKLEEALILLGATDNYHTQLECLSILHQSCAEVGLFEKAYNYLGAANTMQQEIFNSNDKHLKHIMDKAAHDMKEPLRMVSSYTSLLERILKDKLDDETTEFMDYIRSGVGRIHNLLGDLVDYANIGHEQSETANISVGHLIERAKTRLRNEFEESRAELAITELPVLEGSEPLLFRLFYQLIDNAVKFRTDNSPEINIESSEYNDYYLFSIRDNGIGIAEEHQGRVFEIFSRLNSREAYNGSGIGLAICKKIIELLKGKIWIESEYGKGCTVHFTIPKKVQAT